MSKAKRFLLKLSIFIALAQPALGATPAPQMSGKCPQPVNGYVDMETLGYYVAADTIRTNATIQAEDFVPHMCSAYSKVNNKYLDDSNCAMYMRGAYRAFMGPSLATECSEEFAKKYGGK